MNNDLLFSPNELEKPGVKDCDGPSAIFPDISPMTYYVLIETGYEEDFPYRLGNNYNEFVERYKNMDTLIRIEEWVREGYEDVVKEVLDVAKNSDIYRFNSLFYGGMYLHPIFVTHSVSPENIDRIVQKARDLDYCHIWSDDPIEKVTKYMIGRKKFLVHIKLEAESG